MSTLALRFAALVLVVIVAACGSDSSPSAVVSPTPSPAPAPGPSSAPAPTPGCSATLAGVPVSVAGAGGQFPLTLTVATGCAWTAQTDVAWATIAPSAGSGSAAPMLRVDENTDVTNSRSATVTVAGQSVRFSQAIGCSFTVDRTLANVPFGGTRVVVELTTRDGCSWRATTSEAWLTVTPTSGTRSEAVTIEALPNPSGSRSGFATIAGRRVQINQEARP